MQFSFTKHRSHSLLHCSIGGSAPFANAIPMDADASSAASAAFVMASSRCTNAAAIAFRLCIKCARSAGCGLIAVVSSSFFIFSPPPGCLV